MYERLPESFSYPEETESQTQKARNSNQVKEWKKK